MSEYPSATTPGLDLSVLAGQPPVVRFVNEVLGQAIRERASDVHFEPFEQEFKIRSRVDGVLRELPSPSRELALPVASRLKLLAGLDIAERRLPQDGRIQIQYERRNVDLRVSTLPTQFGESIVLRVLDQSAVKLDLGQLGLPADVLSGLRDVVQRPSGLLLVTGPTGSGKTTTLYGGLREVNRTGLKLLTAEDPVEYEIEGIVQVPVNLAAGLTFATALRAFLRQDPDVIMVGEIRDRETALVAMQAALTGHLVMSTLHTNDAPSAVARLLDLGVEPFLVTATVEAVLAQRLLRRVCHACREPWKPPAEWAGSAAYFHGHGCAACGGTGYRGRLGIHEWLPMTDALREQIIAEPSTMALRQRAREAGMRTLREAGLRAAQAGETTWEEVMRYT